jgi:hypothetical protein
MLNDANDFTPKNAQKFYCEYCDFNCSKNSDFARHLLTSKHIKAKNAKSENAKYICDLCNNEFKHASSLSRHKKKCKEPSIQMAEESVSFTEDKPDIVEILINENKDFKNIILDLVKSSSASSTEDKPDIVELLMNENKDFKNIILDLVKTNTELQQQMLNTCKTGIVTNSTINSHNNNKTFNLQFFLNEQCKDAMNIMDFVNTFQLQLSDFERIGEVGYVEGISTIVMDKLNQMDVYKRPIHCSDAKRETMHVKDNGVWTKDTTANDKIRLALKHITKKNTDMIRPWLNAHPGVLNSEHKLNDKYQEMFIEAMGGRKNKNIKEGEDKIIKKISKMVLIDKSSVGRHP